ncbi:MAG: phosphoglucosamine mutase [Endomicrobium sp.]|nr:phosphoglucosamine mutase [Endomicrobium sp.]
MKLFGTDGIRGDSSKFPFDNATLRIIGKSIAEILGAKKEVLIIRDTRESGERIQKELAKGIVSASAVPVFGGIMPTPAASFLIKSDRYSAAIVISASHNLYMDNGIKIFNSKGLKLGDSVEARIEKKINKYLALKVAVSSEKIKIKEDSKLLRFYENFVIKNFIGCSLKGKMIVVDCANGASYKCAPYVLKKLGAKVVALNVDPNGRNVNLNCGALHPGYAAKLVKKLKTFCGFAFDGDADRLICIDEKGIVRDGDYFLASMASWLKSKKKLKNNTLVATIVANMGFLQAMKREKIKVISAKVGDKYVVEDMKKYKAIFGGEQSGHFIFKDILATGDGLLSAVMLLAALSEENKKMSEFIDVIEKFPQIFVNKKVSKRIPIEKLSKSYKLIKDYEKLLGVNGRILVRYSGTENLLRVMVEGKDIKEIEIIAENLADSIEKEIESCG